MKYTGVIVKESLADTSILDKLQVVSQKTVGPQNDTWDLVTVKVTDRDIANLKYFLKDGPWYANFWSDEEMIVVFKERIISNEQEAIRYGLSIGISKEQLDFKKG